MLGDEQRVGDGQNRAGIDDDEIEFLAKFEEDVAHGILREELDDLRVAHPRRQQ